MTKLIIFIKGQQSGSKILIKKVKLFHKMIQYWGQSPKRVLFFVKSNSTPPSLALILNSSTTHAKSLFKHSSHLSIGLPLRLPPSILSASALFVPPPTCILLRISVFVVSVSSHPVLYLDIISVIRPKAHTSSLDLLSVHVCQRFPSTLPTVL